MKTDLYGSEVTVQMIDTKLNSFRSPVSSQAMTSNGVNVDELPRFIVFIIVKSYFTLFVYLYLFSSLLKVSEIVQASSSAQTNDEEDQEVDDAIIDKIIVDKVNTMRTSSLILTTFFHNFWHLSMAI